MWRAAGHAGSRLRMPNLDSTRNYRLATPQPKRLSKRGIRVRLEGPDMVRKKIQQAFRKDLVSSVQVVTLSCKRLMSAVLMAVAAGSVPWRQ